MSSAPRNAFPPPVSLLDFLFDRGWKPVRDSGREEVAGLCPLHRDRRPSFYVNRRKQVFYCHGCGMGGGLARLVRLLDRLPEPVVVCAAPDRLPDRAYRFYERQLAQSADARAYLARRGIHDPAVIARMRIGYAPGACLRGYLQRLGYDRRVLFESGLVNERGRDAFFRCLTFPLEQAGNLYGRSIIASGICRHRFLPGSKGGLYGWQQALAFPRVILVEGLFDLAALWQSGFDNAVAALGSHLNNLQLSELCQGERVIYICFDADRNGSGQRASHRLSVQLRHAGVEALRVELPRGHDPASLFAAGACAADFRRLLDRARP